VISRPDWLAVDRAGRRRRVGDPEVFLCPGNPEARDHLAAVCADLARRYPLDGLQLDYIRYADASLCYCAGCLRRFELQLRARVTPERLATVLRGGRLDLVTAFPTMWGDFRREQVTLLVSAVREAVRRARPSARLSAATIAWGPFPGDFRKSDAYRVTGQDWFSWLRDGLIDAACPMTYHPTEDAFSGWVRGTREALPGREVWYGIGAYQLAPEAAVARIRHVRQQGGRGWLLFSYSAVTGAGRNPAYLSTLARQLALAEQPHEH
jgi:uncharacterized lipoprotein YddW (UPF0748 family)